MIMMVKMLIMFLILSDGDDDVDNSCIVDNATDDIMLTYTCIFMRLHTYMSYVNTLCIIALFYCCQKQLA